LCVSRTNASPNFLSIAREALEGEGGELAAAILDLHREIPRREWIARAVARVLLGTVARKGEGTWLVYARGRRARRAEPVN